MASTEQSNSGAPVTISVTDLEGRAWRVHVEAGWRGLDMTRTYMARLLIRTDGGTRWKAVGIAVTNDDGPIEAISDLLSLLDTGALPTEGN